MKSCSFILIFCILQLTSLAQRKKKIGNPYLDARVTVGEKQRKEDSKINAKELADFETNIEKNKKKVLSANPDFYEKKRYKHFKGKAPKGKKHGRWQL